MAMAHGNIEAKQNRAEVPSRKVTNESVTSELMATVVCSGQYFYGTLLPEHDGRRIFREPWRYGLGIVEDKNWILSITHDLGPLTGLGVWIGTRHD